MMNRLHFFRGPALLLLLGLFHFLQAQDYPFERRIDPFPLLDQNGSTYDYPFFGGMNRPVLQFVDIDGNNTPDLFVQDRASSIIFFRNEGSAQNPDFRWLTDAYQDLTVGEWFKFADVDQDNDFDLFAENTSGRIRYYRNDGNVNNPQFTLAADPLQDAAGMDINLGGFSVPEWADIDCDNELEFFLGTQVGTVSLYDYDGQDANNVPRYIFVTDTFQGLSIQTGGVPNGGTLPKNNGGRHGANSLTFIDIDNDNDKDLFWGDFFANSLIYMENSGDCTSPSIEITTEEYPPASPVQTGGFNVPRFADIDGDMDYDMFIGVLGGTGSFILDRAANFYFYENAGTVEAPDFLLRNKQYINSMDVGQNTIPALIDIDNDDDLDLFLTAEEDLDSPSHANSRVYFFENQGDKFNPEFRLVDKNYLNYDKLYDLNYAPVFIDVDNDNDYDLLIGKWDGKISLFKNEGTPTQPSFSVSEENFQSIDIGFNSTPALVDIDGDNDPDMFVGEFNGNINFFRNNGSLGAPVFELDTTHYLDIDMGSFSYPAFHDIDNDQDYDMLIGSDDGGTVLYRNDGTPQNPQFVLDENFQISMHLRNAPALADIDHDGDLDLFCGVDGGGLVFYENMTVAVGIEPTSPEQQPASIYLLKNYPNPFNPSTTIEYGFNLPLTAAAGDHRLVIYNLLGQKMRSWSFPTNRPEIQRSVQWDGRDQNGSPVPSGIYFYELTVGNTYRASGKMLLAK